MINVFKNKIFMFNFLPYTPQIPPPFTMKPETMRYFSISMVDLLKKDSKILKFENLEKLTQNMIH